MSVMTVDGDEWDADDIRNVQRTANQMTIWKRDGDQRIAELDAACRTALDAYWRVSGDIAGDLVHARETLRRTLGISVD